MFTVIPKCVNLMVDSHQLMQCLLSWMCSITSQLSRDGLINVRPRLENRKQTADIEIGTET